MSDFNINDLVMHNREGLSIIESTTVMGDNEFFVVRVKRSQDQTIYVPVNNASSIIRNIMTKDEADQLLSSLKTLEKEFNPNTKQRRDAFKKRLSSGYIYDIAYLYRQGCLYNDFPDDVKLGPADVDMLGYATNFLLDELSLTYEITREKIAEFVLKRMNEIK